ncbi:MAG: hypothetical protein ACTHLP_15185 [Rhizobiaceae bacterium]|jgi:hypothetical protein
MTQNAGSAAEVRGIDQVFLVRAFYLFAAVALVSALIAAAGRWLGPSISMGGYSDDPTSREIVIGNNVLLVPANMIRFQEARRDGVAPKLDLYLRWPDLTGYTEAARDDFNGKDGRKDILFLSFEPQAMSRDMGGRFEPIYRSLVVDPGTPTGNGVTLYGFRPETGYLNEVLAVAEKPGGGEPFVARCLVGPSADESLAPCQSDVLIGDELSLNYRFPRQFLADWRSLDAAVTAKARSFIRTDK